MKKRLLILLSLLLCAGMAQAQSAQANLIYTINVGDVTVDNQHTASVWEILDTIIVVSTDTATVTLTVSGVAIMDPNDVLYLGFAGHVGAWAAPNVDTLIIQPKVRYNASQRVPFSWSYAVCDTVADPLLFWQAAAVTDTLGLLAACGGGGTGVVYLEDVCFEVFLHKCNDCYGTDYARD